MKRVWLLGCLLLCLLAGCGEQEEQPAENRTWGSVADSPVLARTTAAPSPTPVPTPVPSPTPTPTPLSALTDLAASGPALVADGKSIPTVVAGGVCLVKYEDLSSAFPWFTFKGGREEATFTGKSGESISVSLKTVRDASDLSRFSGSGGILFEGRTTEYYLPVVETASALGARLLWDADNQTAYLATPVDRTLIVQGKKLPVLMYHAVSDDLWGIGSLFVSPANLRAQLKWLVGQGYDPIFFSDLTHLSDYDKPVLLTFDDGYDDNYTNLYPLLQEFQVKATIFVITGMLGDEHYLTEAQVKEMSDSGLCEMESHTVDHFELAGLSRTEQEYQLRQSQLDLARITGKIPYVLSYPCGSHNAATLELLPDYYAFAVKMNGNQWTIAGKYGEISRVYISRFDEMTLFQQKVS